MDSRHLYRPYDQDWLNYQEIGLRHTYAKKNQTDQVEAAPHIGMRYMIAFIYPITATIKPFLSNKGHSAEDVENMYQAWFKSITLQVTLWCMPRCIFLIWRYSWNLLVFF